MCKVFYRRILQKPKHGSNLHPANMLEGEAFRKGTECSIIARASDEQSEQILEEECERLQFLNDLFLLEVIVHPACAMQP